jgi:hypothetical protein
VIDPAEERFLAMQPEFERAVVEVCSKEDKPGVEALVTQYSKHCLKQVGFAYHELVDYLMFRYLVDRADVAMPNLPVIGPPALPARAPAK